MIQRPVTRPPVRRCRPGGVLPKSRHWRSDVSDGGDRVALRASGLSDGGRVRSDNEDAFLVSEQQGLFIVSDGLGGQPAGALAAAMTVQTLPLQLSAARQARRGAEPEVAQSLADELVHAIASVNDIVLDGTRGHPEVRGLGATVVAALHASNDMLALAHLGDSRAYLMRRGCLERLTSDHTLAELLLEQGRIDRRQLRRHPARSMLTRHIGKEDCPPADAAWLPLRLGDRILLCTDGLTGMLSDRDIGTILWETDSPEAVCQLLIDSANRAGGRDNVTVLVIDVTGPGKPRGRRRRRVVVRRRVGRSLVSL